MRELYRDNPSEYNYYYNSSYYNSSLSNYSNQEQEALTSSVYTEDERQFLNPLDSAIASGKLPSVVNSERAINKLMKELGISETVAKLMLLDDRVSLRELLKATSNEAPKYLALAQLPNLNNT